jgi:hypothetical protein
MPRKAVDKPWFHAASGLYCATVQGKREYPDAEYAAVNSDTVAHVPAKLTKRAPWRAMR